MDKPAANPDRVMNEMADLGLLPEEWGGDTIFVKCSAKQGDGVQDILEIDSGRCGNARAESQPEAQRDRYGY